MKFNVLIPNTNDKQQPAMDSNKVSVVLIS